MDLGVRLRTAREQRGISLDTLSSATKINVNVLRALEEERFDEVAHGIFVRGFLRAYAHEVGLDAEEIVARYRAEFEPAPANVEHVDTAASRAADDPTTPASSRLAWLLLAVGIAVAGYFSVRDNRPAASNAAPAAAVATPVPVPTSQPPTDTPPPASPATPLVATAALQEGPAESDAVRSALRIDIEATGSCWIDATADGVNVAYQLLRAGDRQTIEARDEVVLRVGNPAAVTYSLNGEPGRPLGDGSRPITVRLTPQNYRQFLTS